MDRTDFFRQAKVGDTVVLKSDLKTLTSYGTHHFVSSMKLENNEGVIRKIDLDDYSFFVKGKGLFCYTPEMVDHVRVRNGEYLVREKQIDGMISLSGILPAVREFVRDHLVIGDVIKIDRYPRLDYYNRSTMLAPGRTAKIVLSAKIFENHEPVDRKFRLDKDMENEYRPELFDLAYTISRNDRLYRDFMAVFGNTSVEIDKDTAEKTIVKAPVLEKKANIHINTEEIVKGIDEIMQGLTNLRKAFENLA